MKVKVRKYDSEGEEICKCPETKLKMWIVEGMMGGGSKN